MLACENNRPLLAVVIFLMSGFQISQHMLPSRTSWFQLGMHNISALIAVLADVCHFLTFNMKNVYIRRAPVCFESSLRDSSFICNWQHLGDDVIRYLYLFRWLTESTKLMLLTVASRPKQRQQFGGPLQQQDSQASHIQSDSCMSSWAVWQRILFYWLFWFMILIVNHGPHLHKWKGC